MAMAGILQGLGARPQPRSIAKAWSATSSGSKQHPMLARAVDEVKTRLPPWAWRYETLTATACTILIVLLSALLIRMLSKAQREAPPRAALVKIPPCPQQARAGWKPTHILETPSIRGNDDRDGQTIVAYCPATGAKLDEVKADTPSAINNKVKRAIAAQKKNGWSDGDASSWQRRRRVLRTIKAWMVRDMDTLARVACRDTGKTCVDAVLGEILTTLAKIEWLVKYGEKVLGPERRPNNLLLAHKQCTIYHEPVGVVSALVSWVSRKSVSWMQQANDACSRFTPSHT